MTVFCNKCGYKIKMNGGIVSNTYRCDACSVTRKLDVKEEEVVYLIHILSVGENDGIVYSKNCLQDCAKNFDGFPLKGVKYLDNNTYLPCYKSLPLDYHPKIVSVVQGYVTNLTYSNNNLLGHAHITDKWFRDLLNVICEQDKNYDKFFKLRLNATGIIDNNIIKRITNIHSGIFVSKEVTKSEYK